MSRLTKIIAGTAVAALALAGCSSTDAPPSADNSLGTLTAGSLLACSDSPYPPFEFEDSTTPSGYAGFDIDIIQAIADKLGLKLVVVATDFNVLQSGSPLAASCDVGVSAITITDERKANIDFSDPYYDSIQSLLVAKSSGITSLDDLAGKNIGLQSGTTGEIYANANAPASANLVMYPSDGEMWPALQAGQVDALLQDYPVNMSHAKSDPSYAVVAKYETDEHYGFALAKDKNPALLKAINDGLQSLRDDGTYDTIYDKYFS